MARRLFNFLAPICLTIAIALSAMWVRSYHLGSYDVWYVFDRTYIESGDGGLCFGRRVLPNVFHSICLPYAIPVALVAILPTTWLVRLIAARGRPVPHGFEVTTRTKPPDRGH